MTLTKGQKSFYIKNSNICPHCESENLDGGSIEVNDGIATQHISCECGKSWTDIYKLIDIKEE